jgi:4-diphosphocytidyl-2C-methyl-D-erythritol kinase
MKRNGGATMADRELKEIQEKLERDVDVFIQPDGTLVIRDGKEQITKTLSKPDQIWY